MFNGEIISGSCLTPALLFGCTSYESENLRAR